MTFQTGKRVLAWFLLANLCGFGARSAAQKPPAVGKPAPLFTMNDVDEKPHTLKDLRGKPAVILFFCPCEYCKPVSRLWGEAQRSGALTPEPEKETETRLEPPKSLVVYSGDADATREFGEVAGFEKESTVLLPDPKLRTARQYDSIPCPRVFVVDAKGMVRYTNTEAGRMPYKVPAPTIVSRLLSAVHKTLPGKPTAEAKPQSKPKPSGKAGKESSAGEGSGKKGKGTARAKR